MPLDQAGVKEVGWISKWALQIGALAADSFGRQAIEDAYFSADATMRAKFADEFITAAKIAAGAITQAKLESAKLAYLGVYGVGQYGTCLYGT